MLMISDRDPVPEPAFSVNATDSQEALSLLSVEPGPLERALLRIVKSLIGIQGGVQ